MPKNKVDVLLVGAGVMSTTLGMLLSRLDPSLKIMMSVVFDNLDLTCHLVKGALQSHKERVAALSNFYADTKNKEWSLESAGHRVQIIKRCDNNGGKLEFGSKIIASKDGTLASLLGASPGASISVQFATERAARCGWIKVITGAASRPRYNIFRSGRCPLLFVC